MGVQLLDQDTAARAILGQGRTGLVIGGVLAAPFGARIAKRVNPDLLLTFVGAVLTLTSGYGLYKVIV